jgi:hypothetical protein
MKFINLNMYSHKAAKVSNPLERFLHEFLFLTAAIKLSIFFCKLNALLLLTKLPQNLFHTLLLSEKKQNKQM